MNKNILSIFSIFLFILSCQNNEIKNLEGREFVLVNMYKDMDITMIFENGKIYGKAPVNNYMATYSIDKNKIKIENIGTTKMLGPTEFNNAENNFISLLNNAKNIKLKNSKLTITSYSNNVLEFEDVKDLNL